MIIDKMKTLDHLTIQEKYLVDYIINNQEDILKKNINELAKLSYTSSATISRLCKKLGFNGYKEFKYQYAAEYSHLLELKNDFKIEPFSSESSIDDALNKIELLHKRAIEYTKSLLDRQVIERIYQLIKNAKYIEIYGTGINFSLAEIYSLNFEEEGVISKAYNSLNPMHLQYLKQRKPNDTVCNINEPIIFGTPIVLNIYLLIPFVLVPLIIGISSYLLMYMGILPLFSGVMVPWTTPPIISGLLIGGWRVALWQFVMIVVSFVIYLPFIKKIDTLELNKENQK